MTRNCCALFIGAMVLYLTQPGSAAPPWTRDGNCAACHNVALPGALTVTNQDATANPNNHGNLKVFQITPGQTKTLSAAISGLGDGDRYMVMLKGLTGTGVNAGQAFQYGADCGWSQWWRTFFTDPPRSNDPSQYYVSPTGPAQFQYSLQVAANCPNDYYDLTFAVVGVPSEGTGLFYGEEHFYVQVGTGTPTGPAIGLSKTTLTAAAATGANPPNDSFTVTNTGTGTLSYTISDSATWLTVSPTSGSAAAGAANTIAVQYNATSLAAGSYSGTITVAATGVTNSPQTINVGLTIGGSGGNATAGQTLYGQRCVSCHSSASALAPFASRITTNMSSINSSHNGITLTTQQVADLKAYLATFSGGTSPSIVLNKTTMAATAAQGASPANDSFTVANGGPGTLSYTITDSATWLTVTPTSGSSTGAANTIAVQYSTASLAAGSYTGTITVAATGATNSPQTISVGLTIGSSGGGNAANGQTTFTQTCARCHSATSIASAANRIVTNMSSITSSHNGITLTTQQVADLKAYLATVSGGGSPSITLNKTSLTATAAQGATPPNDTFTVTRGGSGTLSYTITDSASWMTVSPTSGSSTGEADTVTVQYNTASLAAGSYSGTITVAASGATNTPRTVSVALTITAPTANPTIALNKTAIARTVTRGSNAPNDTFTVDNTGGGTLNYTVTDNVSWFTVSPTSGSSTGEADTVTVQYNTASLAAGTYSGRITVAASGATNTPQTIAVTLTVTAGTSRPTIALSRTTLTASTQQGSNPRDATFTVRNSGSGTLSYTITDNVSWFTVTPTSGSSTGESDTITVHYSTRNLRAGTYTGTITVSGTNTTNSPRTVRVSLTVTGSGDDHGDD